MSSKKAAKILAAALRAFGGDISQTNINESTIRRQRDKHRASSAEKVRESFSPDPILTLHWDGKMLPSLGSNDTKERLAIVVTGVRTKQMLAAPELPNGSGKAIAEAVFNVVKQWNISNNVKAVAFDTTSANTG